MSSLSCASFFFFLLIFQGGALRERRNHPFSYDAHSFSLLAAALAPGGKGNPLTEEVLTSAAHTEGIWKK